MKHLSIIAAIAALAVSAGSASTNSNNSSTTVSDAPVVHSSSAPAPATPVAPHLSGVPHSLNGIPQHYPTGAYRPTVTYHNGNRVLIYPAVRGSAGHHSAQSSVNSLSSAPALHQSGNRNLQHTATVNIAAKNRLDPQTSARLRHWNGNVSTAAQAQQNHLNNLKHHHDHDWWRHHCVVFIFWDWGWWGWWDGWWYPAWGYDPYSNYGYNEPIYGYEGLSPEQIVADVQSALQELGYYTYAVDGQMGPQTRSAIARYQRDNHLPITYGIDPATLGSLGIIQ